MPVLSIEPLGDCALTVRLGVDLDAASNARVHALAAAIEEADLAGMLDVVPAYASLAIHFDPRLVMSQGLDGMIERIRSVCLPIEARGEEQNPGRLIEIPVCYGGDFGLDLPEVAAATQLSVEEVIHQHSTAGYRVAMLGFAPGFPYLLGLPSQLAVPRRRSPRLRVPAGSVAIAGGQTGIYPNESPGGWNLIGRTPIALFEPACDPPARLRPGDRVRFLAVSRAEFDALAR